MGVRYTTREAVAQALDIKASANMDAQIDSAIESASRSVEGLLHRRFYPYTGTRYFDWPDRSSPTSYRLWLDDNELISVTSVTSGGTAVSASNYFLRRADYKDEAPYSMLELDLSTSASFTQGSTHQKSIAITGVYGYTSTTVTAGTLAEDLDTSETGVDVSDSSLIGVGDLIRVDSEYMNVTDRAMLDTGRNLATGSDLTASMNDVTVTVSGAATYDLAAGETILINSERMLIIDKPSATVLTVKRAVDGTVLAAHTGGGTTHVYAPRTLTVERGSVGTTAATHTTGTSVTRLQVPGPVQELTLAYAINNVLQRSAGYARVAGSGDSAREFTGRGIADLEKAAVRACGRQMLMGGI